MVDEIVCSNIAGPQPPKLEDGSSSVGNCPGDVANCTILSWVFLYFYRDTYTRFQRLYNNYYVTLFSRLEIP